MNVSVEQAGINALAAWLARSLGTATAVSTHWATVRRRGLRPAGLSP